MCVCMCVCGGKERKGVVYGAEGVAGRKVAWVSAHHNKYATSLYHHPHLHLHRACTQGSGQSAHYLITEPLLLIIAWHCGTVHY